MMKKYLNSFHKNGYVLIPNLITKKFCEKLKKLLEKDYKKYSKKYASHGTKKKSLPGQDWEDKSSEKVVFNMHNKNMIWFKLFENKIILKMLDVILKTGSYKNSEPYYLANISARSPNKGNKGQQLHSDSHLAGVNFPLSINVLWLLDDFNDRNGATRIVPGSHKWKKYAINGKVYKSEKKIYGKAGTAFIFDTNLWHGSSAKYSIETRWAVALGYFRWFKKPSFDFMQNTPRKIYNKMTSKQKSLLGFDSVPPKDEFTRLRRRSTTFEIPKKYILPK